VLVVDITIQKQKTEPKMARLWRERKCRENPEDLYENRLRCEILQDWVSRSTVYCAIVRDETAVSSVDDAVPIVILRNLSLRLRMPQCIGARQRVVCGV